MATYYVQTGAASDNSGGTDFDDSLSRTGTAGVSTSNTTFESEAANFVAGDAGRGIWINTTLTNNVNCRQTIHPTVVFRNKSAHGQPLPFNHHSVQVKELAGSWGRSNMFE